MTVQISDWVKGKTNNGELFHGFVEAEADMHGIVKVYVVSSDNEEAVGKEVAVREQWLKLLPESSLDDAGALQNFIDLALSTRDESWFKELSEQLSSNSKSENTIKQAAIPNPFLKNRLGYSGIM
ncbi:IDEAL domain-containing protein [Paenibacillus beijingensis]|uniref:IDEAL domain-containing protein n=1 Tax=Paenibacillus beijingensis TaxID=1126833 RepID=A0A0D5NPM0_9BACL|nr:IDEAL domain-containing protein [Paenibacillus beijingensis]AJY76962.1 hypothetical protein VN24_23390 [Paenibacillus beijingensis]